jgi:hypothetical protein
LTVLRMPINRGEPETVGSTQVSNLLERLGGIALSRDSRYLAVLSFVQDSTTQRSIDKVVIVDLNAGAGTATASSEAGPAGSERLIYRRRYIYSGWQEYRVRDRRAGSLESLAAANEWLTGASDHECPCRTNQRFSLVAGWQNARSCPRIPNFRCCVVPARQSVMSRPALMSILTTHGR